MDILNLIRTVGEDGVIICGSERLARDLRMRLVLARSAAGVVQRFGLTVTTWNRWLEERWSLLFEGPQLLHPVQELALFKQVIDRSGTAEHMISTMSAARLTRQARRLVRLYGLSQDPAHYGYTDDTQAFHGWMEGVEAEKVVGGWVADSDLADRVAQAYRESVLPLPSGLAFVGFLELLNQQSVFCDALRALGVPVHIEPLPASDRPIVPMVARTRRDECALVAGRVADLLSPFRHDPEGAPRIGILVPDFTPYRAPLHQALVERVSPAEVVPAGLMATTRGGIPWDFAGGVVLGDFDLVSLAMDLLRLGGEGSDLAAVSRILLSPRLASSADDRTSRAGADLAVREMAATSVGLSRLAALCERRAPRFSAQVTTLAALRDERGAAGDAEHRPSEWASIFDGELHAMGWPTAAELTSVDYQVVQAWEESLAVFSSMDRLLGSMKRSRAFMWLREIVATKQFQPRRDWVTPIQIMTYRDALGLDFDYVFAMGLDSTSLPQAATPNPFVPRHLQEQARIEASNPEVALEYARAMMAYLRASSRELTASYASMGDDALPRSPCALVPELFGAEAQTAPASSLMELYEVGVHEDHVTPEDDVFPPMAEAEAAGIKGGVAIFGNMALSPWLAQARHRLGLREFPQATVGIDHRAQGEFVHAVLERFWLSVKTSDRLLSMSDADRQAELEQHIETIFQEEKVLPSWRFGSRLLAVERIRVISLLQEWLQIEAARLESFEVVAVEREAEASVGGIPLKVKVDRIDRVATDRGPKYLLGDYKSKTKVDPREWNTGSLTEPQLPIYSAVVGANGLGIPDVNGIAFAHVTPIDPTYHVRTDWTLKLVERRVTGGEWEATPAAWEAQQQAWATRLEEIAVQFKSGVGIHDFGLDADREYFGDLLPLLIQGD